MTTSVRRVNGNRIVFDKEIADAFRQARVTKKVTTLAAICSTLVKLAAKYEREAVEFQLMVTLAETLAPPETPEEYEALAESKKILAQENKESAMLRRRVYLIDKHMGPKLMGQLLGPAD